MKYGCDGLNDGLLVVIITPSPKFQVQLAKVLPEEATDACVNVTTGFGQERIVGDTEEITAVGTAQLSTDISIAAHSSAALKRFRLVIIN